MPDPFRDISNTISQTMAELDIKKPKKKKSKKSAKDDDVVIDPAKMNVHDEYMEEPIPDVDIDEDPEEVEVDHVAEAEEAEEYEQTIQRERDTEAFEALNAMNYKAWEEFEETFLSGYNPDDLSIDYYDVSEEGAKYVDETSTQLYVETEAIKSKHVVRIPPGIINRWFIRRDGEWKGKVWTVNPGGARSFDGEQREMTKEMIALLVNSKGLIAMEGEPLVIVERTEEEHNLVDKVRREEDERAKEVQPETPVTDVAPAGGGEWFDLGDQPKTEVDVKKVFDVSKEIILSRFVGWVAEQVEILVMMFLAHFYDGRIVYSDEQVQDVYPLLFIVAIGPPSAFKSSVYRVLKKAFTMGNHCKPIAIKEWTVPKARLIIYEGTTEAPKDFYDDIDEGIREFEEKKSKGKKGKGPKQQKLISGGSPPEGNHAIILEMDECASIFNPQSPEEKEKKSFLISIYDEPENERHRVDNSKDFSMNTACPSFYGTIQTSRFYRHCNLDDVETGFFGRMTPVFLTRKERKIPVQGRFKRKNLEMSNLLGAISIRIWDAVKDIPYDNPAVYDLSDEALKELQNYTNLLYRRIEKANPEAAERYEMIALRNLTLAKKFAMIYQVLDDIEYAEDHKLKRSSDKEPNYLISRENIIRAIKLSGDVYNLQLYLYEHLGTGKGTDYLKRLNQIFDDPKEEKLVLAEDFFAIRKTRIYDRTGWEKKDMDAARKTLEEWGKYWVHEVGEGKRGRKAEFFCNQPPSRATMEQKAKMLAFSIRITKGSKNPNKKK